MITLTLALPIIKRSPSEHALIALLVLERPLFNEFVLRDSIQFLPKEVLLGASHVCCQSPADVYKLTTSKRYLRRTQTDKPQYVSLTLSPQGERR